MLVLGYLLLGHSDSLDEIDDRLVLQDTLEKPELVIIIFLIGVNLVALMTVSV